MSGMANHKYANGGRTKRNITQVINDYSKRLKGFIRKRVTNEADAEDILQDVFYQLIGNTQPIEQLTAWLFTVTRNKITDRQRKQKPELIEDIYTNAEGEDSINWTEFFPTQMETLNRNTSEAYSGSPQQCIGRTTGRTKRVFILNELEGVPFKVIAGETGETNNTLISRKRYAVLHLREGCNRCAMNY